MIENKLQVNLYLLYKSFSHDFALLLILWNGMEEKILIKSVSIDIVLILKERKQQYVDRIEMKLKSDLIGNFCYNCHFFL